MKKPELLAPAGDLEKLKYALTYGADAVYAGGMRYGLRERAGNFSEDELKEGIAFAHERGKKVYITVNAMPHNDGLEGLPEYLQALNELKPDALIISDPGVLVLAKEHAPDLEYHLSTQANTVNYISANFWQEQGISRLILARELSLEELKDFRKHSTAELEVFIHGAMCMAYSGRCLISNFMTGRNANQGDCAQVCRWPFAVAERRREGEYFPMEETQEGTYIFYSKDLSMIEHMPEVLELGLDGLKIEGRMKSLHYVATVVAAYRKAIDSYFADPADFEFDSRWLEEIKKAGTRELSTGFYFGKPGEEIMDYSGKATSREIEFVGIVEDYKDNMLYIQQRNNFKVGDKLEILSPGFELYHFEVKEMYNQEGEAIEVAPHPLMKVQIPLAKPIKQHSLLRKLTT
ncbi:MAG: U32 family peptidase [Firmicutes bacterium]|nr:U32 family peptidase [Bacillota bacterium]